MFCLFSKEFGIVSLLVGDYSVDECMVVFLCDLGCCYVVCGFFGMCFVLSMLCGDIVNYLCLVLEMVSWVLMCFCS